MKYKHYLYISSLILFLLLSHLTVAQEELSVDLSQIQVFGIQSNKVQINNIIVKVIIPDPLIPNNTQEVILPPYNLPFKACQFEDGLLRLIPLLDSFEPDCYIEGVDFSPSNGFARDENAIQINNIQFQTLVDPIDPNRIEIINNHSVFRFEPATLYLVQSFEPIILTPPTQIKILLKWSDYYQVDLDAHLLTPMAPHSVERFHLYFGEKGNDVAVLNNGEYPFEGQEEITIFPPPVEPALLRPGIYTYVVQYFRGIGNILDSQAVVSLQIGDGPRQEFTPPPPPQPNDLEQLFDNNFRDNSMENWVVFELHVADDGMVTVVPTQNYNGIIF